MEQIELTFESSSSDYTKAELALLSPDDIYSRADEGLIRRLEEDRRIERKVPSIHGEELGQYFSMWANTPKGGLIVVGQRDNGVFVGCSSLPASALNNLEKAGRYHCPDADVDSRRISVHNEHGQPDFVLLFKIGYHEKRVVKTVAGKAYIRSGDEKTTLTPDQIRQVEVEKGVVDLEQELVDLRFPEDFNQNLIREYVDSLIKEKGLSKSHTDCQILAQGHLGKIRDGVFRPNIACSLLFGKDPLALIPGCKVQVLRFDGDFEKTGADYNVVKNIWAEGCIPEVIVEADRAIASQLREFSSLHSDGRFYTAEEYPYGAWHEALVNAVVHRSYALKNMVTFRQNFRRQGSF